VEVRFVDIVQKLLGDVLERLDSQVKPERRGVFVVESGGVSSVVHFHSKASGIKQIAMVASPKESRVLLWFESATWGTKHTQGYGLDDPHQVQQFEDDALEHLLWFLGEMLQYTWVA
jgi:hypothetical protein